MHVGNDSVSERSHIHSNSNMNTATVKGGQNLVGHQVTMSSTTITQITVITQHIVKNMTNEAFDNYQARECEFLVSSPNPSEVSKIQSFVTYPDSSQNYSTSNQVVPSSFNQAPIASAENDEDYFDGFDDFGELNQQSDFEGLNQTEEEVVEVKQEVIITKQEVTTAKQEVTTAKQEVEITVTENAGVTQTTVITKETITTSIKQSVEETIVALKKDRYTFGKEDALTTSLHQTFSSMAESDPDFATKGFNREQTRHALASSFAENKDSIYKIGPDGQLKALSDQDFEELIDKATEHLFNAFVTIGLAFVELNIKREKLSIEPTVFFVKHLPPDTDHKVDVRQEIVRDIFKSIVKTEIQIQESIQRGIKRKWAEEKELLQEEIKLEVKKAEIKHYEIKQEGIKQSVLAAQVLATQILKQEQFISSATLVRAE